MEQYILKSTLVAEIENLLDKGRYHEEYDCAYRDGNNNALYALKDKLDTFKVKKVDLEKEFDSYCKDLHSIDIEEEPFTQMYECAKHFFELGLKAKA